MRTILVSSVFVLNLACRGDVSDAPPVHLNPNMDKQERYLAQEGNTFFEDRRAMRPEVPGTVARGSIHETRRPPLDRDLLERGQQRYNIYCSMCHGGAGLGDGIVIRRGMLPPPSYLDPRIRRMSVEQIHQVITQGVRNMASYAAQIPPHDRWTIVAYVRALQLARSATLDDVPADIAASKGWAPK